MHRYLLIADVHLGLYSDSETWHNITINFFKSVVRTCKKEKIKNIIILGDFFHERKNINIKTLNVALNIIESLKDYNVYLIAGNHDVYYKNSLVPSSLEIFNKYKHVNVINKTHIIDDKIALVPWQEGLPDNVDVVMGHFAINSFYTNESIVYNSKEGLNINDFKKYKHVFSGHFHAPSKKNNIVYLGAPYQQNFGDAHVNRGYYIFDSESYDIKMVKYTNAPKFIKIQTKDKITKEIVEGNFVRLFFNADYGRAANNRLISTIMLFNPLQLHTDFSNINIEYSKTGKTIDFKLKDKNEILNDYLDIVKLPEHIKKKTLLSVIKKIMIEEE